MSRRDDRSANQDSGFEAARRTALNLRTRSSSIGLALVLLLGSGAAFGDRAILAPRGLVLSPGALQLEYAGRFTDGRANREWVTAGVPGDELGLEIEGERLESAGRARSSLSLQYTLTGNAFSDIAPAISVGVRDLANAGLEGRALFFAFTKTVGLSEAQERLIRGLTLNAGYGTSRMDGPFASLEARLRPGFSVSLEYLARRVNAKLDVPLGSYLHLGAYSLNGAMYYGASIYVRR